ncbi:STAS/SEC14 domain-containing protein [Chitinilyticum piscinae]|uniref:STAS/SEC14 domain-containing protein n=1 Tax=Chitinilyticum piscinae TaxID=2866724 RepID=A0A8J7K8P1_9NEIS|nr:STAS/SEC14 domain-containing protein [Chitinilyticum piscinae]MBE9609808.1 STAS/SEC14 domain-containing protein [Chitinilyticum piscinae]
MITVTHEQGSVLATVLGEFTVQDFRQFEEEVLYDIRQQGRAKLLLDLSDMVTYTIDMALEEVRFLQAHRQQFEKVAIVSSDQWVTWSVWLNRMIAESEIEVFEELQPAMDWLAE